jgi:hypothetical protein
LQRGEVYKDLISRALGPTKKQAQPTTKIVNRLCKVDIFFLMGSPMLRTP